MAKLSFVAELEGKTTEFSGNGRKLGYPTANISSPASLDEGVYFGYADLAGYTNHPALIFIGVPVTVGDTQYRIEAHLLDIPDENYYAHLLKLRVEHFHRPNQSFDSIQQLVEVMHSDETAARKWFKEQG